MQNDKTILKPDIKVQGFSIEDLRICEIDRVGVILLYLEEPQKVIFRISKPILETEKENKKINNFPKIVFSVGSIVGNDKFLLYCGGWDKYTILLSYNIINKLIDYMFENCKVK